MNWYDFACTSIASIVIYETCVKIGYRIADRRTRNRRTR